MWKHTNMAFNNKTHNTKIRNKTMKKCSICKQTMQPDFKVKIREMTNTEAEKEGWRMGSNGCRVIELDNGICLYASQDYEGNGPGALFFHNKKGEIYAI